MAPDRDLPEDGRDRRGIERRVEMLERQYNHVMNTLTRLETLQTATASVIDSRHRAQEAESHLMLEKMDNLTKDINRMGSEASESPAGRALKEDIVRLAEQCAAYGPAITNLRTALDAHQKWQDRVDGVLYVLKWMGAGGVAALIAVLLRMIKVIP